MTSPSSGALAVDGNEAAARVAYAASEVVAIYPITPASPMGELADAWASTGRANLWGDVPDIIEMQSEGGAAGALHGALQGGSLATTFTASQGLLLMIPNMFKIAGQLLPAVIHVAARSVATHALSIFCDHSDVMATRSTGWATLSSSSVQEAHDMAAIAHALTLRTRVPVLHFFDGFRTSHEVNEIQEIPADTLRSLLSAEAIAQIRARRLQPEAPALRGSAQNPDVFFQAREAVNRFYEAVPGHADEIMRELAEATGRSYQLFDYHGAPDAEEVAVILGSGASAVRAAVDHLNKKGGKTGVVQVRLYRPFHVPSFMAALPSTARRIAVLDRTKEPGATGEPLYLDVASALAQAESPARAIGGRFGLGSKELNPAMVEAVFHELRRENPRHGFTVGIVDDVSHTSLEWERNQRSEPEGTTCAVFYGLGSDGTVGASKSTCKIISEQTDLTAQGFFVYDSKKSGAVTVSHLRIGAGPIDAAWLISAADVVACHQFSFLDKIDVLQTARPGAKFLLNAPYGPGEVWAHLPREVQSDILDKRLELWVIDAHGIAADAGLGGRINTVMQTAFFALTGVIPLEEATTHMRAMIEKTYGKRGAAVLRRNYAAVEAAAGALQRVEVPTTADSPRHRRPPVPETAPDFVQRVTAMMLERKGDLLPVSALPVDGTFPTGTASWEKRGIASEIPIWDADLCIECGLCALVCPHAAIRTKSYPEDALIGAPDSFLSRTWRAKKDEGWRMTVQVAPEDCTGCAMCVHMCPAHSKEEVKHKAINMEPMREHLETERARYDFFLDIPEIKRDHVRLDTLQGSQLLQPLFEYSGACAGCGETPYLKLMSQLFGDRSVIANATGCSSIYGGNLPTTPWSTNAEGRGPAWANSLFEDNAEFGLGIRLALDHLSKQARASLPRFQNELGESLVSALLESPQNTEAEIEAQRERIAKLRKTLAGNKDAAALLSIADALEHKSLWIVGGDGWAYDIGFGGLDHVLAAGRNVNILVLDTEVYSNTGGQASKATPLGAIAKFAASGKTVGKKDLGMIAMAYGHVYVAQVALGANPKQTLRAFREAESYPGTSLILAYSHCIAHGIDMSRGMEHMRDAVRTGYWPLYRYDPRSERGGGAAMQLDSHAPNGKFRQFAQTEARFAILSRVNPEHADELLTAAEHEIASRWDYYKQMSGVHRDLGSGSEEAS